MTSPLLHYLVFLSRSKILAKDIMPHSGQLTQDQNDPEELIVWNWNLAVGNQQAGFNFAGNHVAVPQPIIPRQPRIPFTFAGMAPNTVPVRPLVDPADTFQVFPHNPLSQAQEITEPKFCVIL